MDQSIFTIATTDNIDFLQSHASVYAGSLCCSWHGTSVQVVKLAGIQTAVTGIPLRYTARVSDTSTALRH